MTDTVGATGSGTFHEAFRMLTGHDPFPWQASLYRRFANGRVPSLCRIPTGLGKTNVVTIWLIALANGAKVPRRLAYVVNRRTVVDQTTSEVERLRANLAKLKADGFDDLAVSTLRGQFADNGKWSADPSRPSVVCGTVDMIGSRLLFSGYRIGFRSRPLHAGFLGQDCLLVHDESHLEPAFQQLVETIKREQSGGKEAGDLPWPRLHVMALSATARHGAGGTSDELSLQSEDHEHPVVRQRISARKHLLLHPCADEKKPLVSQLLEKSLAHEGSQGAVLVYVRRLTDALELKTKLEKQCQGRVASLTGTMRGYERDELVRHPVFIRFLPPDDRDTVAAPAEGTVYLVCTSAGEVGVNLSADHMVGDLSTFESMAQRFGRVNRFGNREDSRLDVVHPQDFDDKDPLTPSRRATLRLLEKLDGDASPAALEALDAFEHHAAFTPEPRIPPATDVLFDAWALTTIRQPMPGRPAVEPYLHGIAEWEPPQTHVAWREEVGIVTGEVLDRYQPAELLEDYPLKPHELLRDRNDRVFKELKALANRHPSKPVWIVDEQGRVEVSTLEGLTSDKQNKDRIGNCTVLLPPSVGGLSDGMLYGKSKVADDVADMVPSAVGARLRVYSNDQDYDSRTSGMRRLRSIEIGASEGEDAEPLMWDWYEALPLEEGRTAKMPVAFETHQQDVERRAGEIVERLRLPRDMALALRLAARGHDCGKQRQRFQTALGNYRFPDVVLAKSGRRGARLPEPYRHEFASCLDIQDDPEFAGLTPHIQDLVLHLIAAHHGRARPHFDPDEAFDPDRPMPEADSLAIETPRRFARLQRKYGRWGLAYLESLLRAADWAASARPSAYTDHTETAT
ncbi:MAG: type I-U CRISPR-associated helicase/endonuclease Cas3 [bacterium]